MTQKNTGLPATSESAGRRTQAPRRHRQRRLSRHLVQHWNPHQRHCPSRRCCQPGTAGHLQARLARRTRWAQHQAMRRPLPKHRKMHRPRPPQGAPRGATGTRAGVGAWVTPGSGRLDSPQVQDIVAWASKGCCGSRASGIDTKSIQNDQIPRPSSRRRRESVREERELGDPPSRHRARWPWTSVRVCSRPAQMAGSEPQDRVAGCPRSACGPAWPCRSG